VRKLYQIVKKAFGEWMLNFTEESKLQLFQEEHAKLGPCKFLMYMIIFLKI
jgi:hypothetical protein